MSNPLGNLAAANLALRRLGLPGQIIDARTVVFDSCFVLSVPVDGEVTWQSVAPGTVIPRSAGVQVKVVQYAIAPPPPLVVLP
ncbi:MAG: hypothetical protein ACREJB_03240 [Planctomycetaceae bacterium]